MHTFEKFAIAQAVFLQGAADVKMRRRMGSLRMTVVFVTKDPRFACVIE